MNEIQNLIKIFLENYLSDKLIFRTASRGVPSKIILEDQLPKLFSKQPGIPSNYYVKGSIGEGNMTSHPWICFLDPEISQKSVRIGYYVSLLIRIDMQGFYLSLNQGWTQYQQEFGTKQGKDETLKNSIKARELLRSAPDFDGEILDLGATGELGKGYERGNIYSKFYSITNLPSDKELLDNIIALIGVHRELKGIVGDNILNIRSLASEASFQKEVQETKIITFPDGPIQKPNKTQKKNSSSHNRNPKIGRIALQNSGYKCEIDNSHNTFISKFTSRPFLEVHHLVPMEKQDEFEVSLDVPENVIALCPNCHRKVHFASEKEKEPMLSEMFNLRYSKLIARAINITMNDINNIYKQIEILE